MTIRCIRDICFSLSLCTQILKSQEIRGKGDNNSSSQSQPLSEAVTLFDMHYPAFGDIFNFYLGTSDSKKNFTSCCVYLTKNQTG